ncbi:nuclear GTPase SLIP-GC-like isoform X1 [Sinocyclocheilus anshuiensis]|uniref:nuclear GTPase SLIP-GC-like isoform X1 n=2 Tax=Sinocyclocheilus anshuiensis TaxID=1608454 RepID=UPI0007BA6F5E|nr:PREDICTED: nuclear GTPase SLIP-GC-like isoform X1 [Sinocyclocheilus anshuiensis]
MHKLFCCCCFIFFIRSAIFFETPREEMDKIHGMTKNLPPLLRVPSQPSTSSVDLSNHPTMPNQGTKRKRDHESSDSEPPLTTDTEIMLKAKQIMKRVTDNLVHTIIMHKDIISKINKINTVNRKKATIGIFGKSGEGKSSLLSAILGKKNLLPSGCFGACTAVITQVEANLTDSNYTAEIELFSKEEWEKELKDLLTVLSDENEDRNEDLIEIAEEKITALYGDDADKKTLEELKKDEKFAEIENLLSINKETENSKKISKSDVSEFASDVARYMLNSEACSGGWYWPLVKSVTIKIPDCRELMEHIVLVDIPGTGDCNKTRDDLWKSKLRECSSVWIVSAINRAITDRDPWGILKHCIEELGPGGECKSINFICTKTDEMDPVDFMRAARLTGDQISEEKEQKKMCISQRNELAKTRVKEKFENSKIKKRFSTDNDFLQVFTVSSKAFFDTSLNLESIETEIPKLQIDLRSLNKSINQELTREYVNEAKGVLSLIQSVQLDTDKKTAETKDRIRMELENNLMKALNELETYFDNIYNDLEQRLSKGVEESVQSCVASTKAFIMPIAYNTLEALCRKGGCHCPKNRDKVLNLNKTLAKHLHEYIDEDFCQIFPVSEKTGKSVQEQIDKFTILQSDSAYRRSTIFHYIQNFIKTEETKLKTSLKRYIIEMKKDIYSSIKKNIVNEMVSCYEQTAAFKGPGCLKRMQNLLITTVDKIKQNMFNKAKMEVLKKCDNLKLHIQDVLESELKRAMNLSLSQTSKTKSMDVSKEIEELEGLLEQLSD